MRIWSRQFGQRGDAARRRVRALSEWTARSVVMLFALMSLSRRTSWAQWANTLVGLWLLFAPLVFWSPSAATYLNSTLIGALVIAFSVLVR